MAKKVSSPKMLTMKHLELVRDYPHVLGNILGKTKLKDIHSQWIKDIWDTFKHSALQAHRGSFKTTAMEIGVIRWLLFNPDDRLGIVRKTFSDAAEVVTVIKHLMEKPETKELFKLAHGFYPKMMVKQNGSLLFNFKQTVTPELSVTAHGLDGSLTGHHYDKLWLDDIITIKDRLSKAERERTIEMIREIYTNIIDPGKPVMLTGTPWHKNDGWSALPSGIEIQKYPVSALDILSPEEIENKKKTTTPFLYSINYDLEFQTEADLLFKNPSFQAWDYLAKGCLGHLDGAWSGDCFNALTFMTPLEDGFKQAKGFVYEGNVKDWLDEIALLYKKHRCQGIYVESNADKGYTADALRNRGCTVFDYFENQNKEVKIATHLYAEWDNLLWSEETNETYLEQITDWKKGQKPDDAPDSAASLCREAFSAEHKHQYNPEAWKL